MRRAPACLIRRYAKLTAVNVLPLPVAIWMSERGLFSKKERSSPPIASTWQSRSPAVTSGGISFRRARSVSGSRDQRINVSGRWNANTRRERYSGSRMSRNTVSTPVLS